MDFTEVLGIPEEHYCWMHCLTYCLTQPDTCSYHTWLGTFMYTQPKCCCLTLFALSNLHLIQIRLCPLILPVLPYSCTCTHVFAHWAPRAKESARDRKGRGSDTALARAFLRAEYHRQCFLNTRDVYYFRYTYLAKNPEVLTPKIVLCVRGACPRIP